MYFCANRSQNLRDPYTIPLLIGDTNCKSIKSSWFSGISVELIQQITSPLLIQSAGGFLLRNGYSIIQFNPLTIGNNSENFEFWNCEHNNN